MQKRSLKELNLLDDFLFGSMVNYPGIGEAFSRELLKIIFQREFGKLTVIPQKVYFGADTNKHGARLDVYLEEDLSAEDALATATIYDIEPDTKDAEKYISALPKRVRFYHAKIDGNSLESGEDYRALKNVIIIMITPYDPFDLDRMIYTIQNVCVEEPDMPYEDGAKTLFLYTKGTKGNPTEELKQLLQYMEHTEETYATNDELQKIQDMVDIVKQDKEVSLAYMKIFEREAMLIDQGKELGQALERENTRKAELRAETAEQQAKTAQQQAEAAQQQVKVAEQQAEVAQQQAEVAQQQAEAAQQQLKHSIIEFLQEYTTVPQWLEDKIMSESSMATLSSWLKISAKSQSMEDFVKQTNLTE